jgi:hypothetical protein
MRKTRTWFAQAAFSLQKQCLQRRRPRFCLLVLHCDECYMAFPSCMPLPEGDLYAQHAWQRAGQTPCFQTNMHEAPHSTCLTRATQRMQRFQHHTPRSATTSVSRLELEVQLQRLRKGTRSCEQFPSSCQTPEYTTPNGSQGRFSCTIALRSTPESISIDQIAMSFSSHWVIRAFHPSTCTRR